MALKKIVLVLLVLALVLSSGCLQGIRSPKPELCEKISQQQNKDICYYNVALAKGDDLLCGRIVSLDERDNCYMDLAVGRSSRSSGFID